MIPTTRSMEKGQGQDFGGHQLAPPQRAWLYAHRPTPACREVISLFPTGPGVFLRGVERAGEELKSVSQENESML